MKRRRKQELQIHVEGTASMHLGHILAGFHDMGPPDDTPRRSLRLRSTNRDAVTGMLESPGSMEKHVAFSDGFLLDGMPYGPLSLQADTPGGGIIQRDPSSIGKTPSSAGPTNDSLKFDFDEVVAHFPSPRLGNVGASPSRWSGGSTGSFEQSMFNFPDSGGGGLNHSLSGSFGGLQRSALEAAVDAADQAMAMGNLASGRRSTRRSFSSSKNSRDSGASSIGMGEVDIDMDVDVAALLQSPANVSSAKSSPRAPAPARA